MQKPLPAWGQRQREYWNAVAAGYDGFYKSKWSHLEDTDTLDMLRGVVHKGKCRILELGCGTGYGFDMCKRLNNAIEYVGIDISERMLEQFRLNHCDADFSVICDSMSHLVQYSLGQFDAIIAIYTSLSLSEQPMDTLRDCFQLLKPGGGVFISFANRWSLRRILRWRFGRIEEKFKTRGDEQKRLKTPAWTISVVEAESMLTHAGFINLKVHGQGLLAGVLEIPLLWTLDKHIARSLPQFCHILNIQALKP